MNKKSMILVFAAGLLASCGGTATPTTSTPAGGNTSVATSTETNPFANYDLTAPITVWNDAKEEAVIKDVVKKWNDAAPANNKLNVTFKAVSEADGGSTLGKDPKVKDYPSLVAIADDQLASLAQKQYIAGLSDYFKNKVVAADTEIVVTSSSYENTLYGFPITNDNGYFLYYNSKKLTAGDVKSLETIISKASATGTFAIDIDNGWYGNSFYQAIAGTTSLKWEMKQVGDTVKDVYPTLDWDKPECVKAAEYLHSFLGPAYTAGSIIDADDSAIVGGFGEKANVIAAVSHINNYKAVIEANPDVKCVELPSFTVDGKAHHMASFSGSKTYVVNKYATKGEQLAAMVLGDLLTNEYAQTKRFAERNTIPCNKAAAAACTDLNEGQRALLAQANYAAVQATSAGASYWNVGAAMEKALFDGQVADSEKKESGEIDWAKFLKNECDILRSGVTPETEAEAK